MRGEESIARRGQCAHADSRPDSRRARALLNLSQDELAEASGLARQSIKNIERGVTDPRLSTAMTIKTTLEKAGVQFLEPSDVAVGPGVACVRTK
ncbi:MAG: helix-turn-helix domain-containing protein [Methylovirgula sp.]